MDLGSKTLGLSVSDKTGTIASGYDTLRYENYDELINSLKEIINSLSIDELVLGNPINLDNTKSDRSRETLKFKKLLEKEINIKVNMQDERLSTIEAENILINNNTSRRKRKKVIDKLAAVIILETYLNRK